jgi:Protein of unknown function (DUF2971)
MAQPCKVRKTASLPNQPQHDFEASVMTEKEIMALFSPLESDFTNMATAEGRPLYLAHYTSLAVLEKIMKNEEIWFSHPYFMNDLQEMRFGIVEGTKIFYELSRGSDFIEACGTPQRAERLASYFGGYFAGFDLKHATEIYVFCLSSHDEDPKYPGDTDGLLSMWRGYGANGNGAALVFKTDYLRAREGSPLLAGKVLYASDNERKQWLKNMFSRGLSIMKASSISDDELPIVAGVLFSIMKIFALLSKHKGFQEEKEWRIIYLPDRDNLKLLASQISYHIGPRGIEPKLKYKLEPLKLDSPETWTFHSILHEVILGPSFSSPLASGAVCKMLTAIGKSEFIEKLRVSGIPLRTTGANA